MMERDGPSRAVCDQHEEERLNDVPLPQHAAGVLDMIAGIERDSDLMLKAGQLVLSSGGDGKCLDVSVGLPWRLARSSET